MNVGTTTTKKPKRNYLKQIQDQQGIKKRKVIKIVTNIKIQDKQ